MFWLLALLLLLDRIHVSSCVLPSYTPALKSNNGMGRDELIKNYFLQDYTNGEIAGFLALRHSMVVSIRTIKRVLKALNLRRACGGNESPVERIVYAIFQELESGCGSFLGYRQLTKRLRRKYNLKVTRDTVMTYVRIIDPEGVERRKRRRLKRRRYTTPGPNFLWHIDGWDKLAPFGLYVHGAIDGYSRRILWLEVNSTNKNPKVVASHYLDTIEQLGGVPRRVRSDKGTENIVIGRLQQFFRWEDNDAFSSSKSFIMGKSSANQRIESWWSKLRDGGGGWWINMLKDLRESGIYRDGDFLLNECLKFCFLPILRQELHLVAELWNTHNIQSQKRHEVIGGKPDIMFFLPEVCNTVNYLRNVDTEDVNICRQMYTERCDDYNENIEELVQLLKPGYLPPSNVAEAITLFSEISELLENY